jgi:hypothetical protein
MSRIVVVILIYHRHKPVDLIHFYFTVLTTYTPQHMADSAIYSQFASMALINMSFYLCGVHPVALYYHTF